MKPSPYPKVERQVWTCLPHSLRLSLSHTKTNTENMIPNTPEKRLGLADRQVSRWRIPSGNRGPNQNFSLQEGHKSNCSIYRKGCPPTPAKPAIKPTGKKYRLMIDLLSHFRFLFFIGLLYFNCFCVVF